MKRSSDPADGSAPAVARLFASRLLRDLLLVACPAEAVVFDLQNEVLAHLEATENLADAQADLSLAAERTPVASGRRGDRLVVYRLRER